MSAVAVAPLPKSALELFVETRDTLFQHSCSVLVAVAWSKFVTALFWAASDSGDVRQSGLYFYVALVYACCVSLARALRRSRRFLLVAGVLSELVGFALKDALAKTLSASFSASAAGMLLFALLSFLGGVLLLSLARRVRLRRSSDRPFADAMRTLEIASLAYALGYVFNQAAMGLVLGAAAARDAAAVRQSPERVSPSGALDAGELAWYALVLTLLCGAAVARVSLLRLSSASALFERTLPMWVGYALGVLCAFAFDAEDAAQTSAVGRAATFAVAVTAASLILMTGMRLRLQTAGHRDLRPGFVRKRFVRRRGMRHALSLATVGMALVTGSAWEQAASAAIELESDGNAQLAIRAAFAAAATVGVLLLRSGSGSGSGGSGGGDDDDEWADDAVFERASSRASSTLSDLFSTTSSIASSSNLFESSSDLAELLLAEDDAAGGSGSFVVD